MSIGVAIFVLNNSLGSANSGVESYIAESEGRVTFLSWSNSNGELKGDGREAWWSEDKSAVVIEHLTVDGVRQGTRLQLNVTYRDGSSRRITGVDSGLVTFFDPVGDGSSNAKIFSPSTESAYLHAVKLLARP